MTQVKMVRLPVIVAIDPGAGTREFEPLSEKDYAIVKKVLPLYCVDIVAVNTPQRLFYLARRRRSPRSGWWWFGGRIGQDELPEKAAQRKLAEELGINVEPSRLKMVGIILHYTNENGVAGTYPVAQMAFEPTHSELAAIRLEPKEYFADSGITAFDRETLT